MAAFTWDDLRVVLAIESSGTALGAAKQLDLSHSTVLRRLATLELARYARDGTGMAVDHGAPVLGGGRLE